MEQITSGLGALAAAAPLLMAGAVWMSPEALRWCIMRLSMRVHYIEAGRTAAQIERERHEVTA
jgi:hypothetical protein